MQAVAVVSFLLCTAPVHSEQRHNATAAADASLDDRIGMLPDKLRKAEQPSPTAPLAKARQHIAGGRGAVVGRDAVAVLNAAVVVTGLVAQARMLRAAATTTTSRPPPAIALYVREDIIPSAKMMGEAVTAAGLAWLVVNKYLDSDD
eukprot:gnl/TRDRNA2_/TRDRNA2_59018_c0_seq1.p1 gnl/TRDRNA2_/TRDRNA2_59018_c0~~gnl/TRDRNA2_/TRDRNA2_59018_c0_seq1.p1  ORF type:complete len:147 (+),score=31.72 gnl/TRDRNA2_/TRDRNA2_59018_c0_seq1:117-557(+)